MSSESGWRPVLLDQRKFAAAESVLRPVSEVRRKNNPDDWHVYATLARLADALVGLGRYGEAEPLLITAQQELTQRAQAIPEKDRTVLARTVDTLIRLYTAWEKPDKRLRWEREARALQ